MTEKEMLKINSIYSITSIPISIIGTDNRTIYCCPEAENTIIGPKAMPLVFRHLPSDDVLREMPFIFNPFFNFYIGVVQSKENKIVIGPIAPGVNSEKMFQNYSHVMSTAQILKLDRLCHATRDITLFQFASVISLLNAGVNNNSVNPETIIEKNNINPIQIANPDGLNLQTEKAQIEDILHFEMELNRAISSGNLQRILMVQNKPMPSFEHLTSNNTVDEHFILLPILTLMSRSCIFGGGDSVVAIAYYDECIRKYMKATSSLSFVPFIFSAAKGFCQIVAESKKTAGRPEICDVIESYIDLHIREQLSISDISKLCGLSDRQIQRLFKKYFACTVTQYITKRKLAHAAAQILTTQKSFTEISQDLGFISQSYFSKKFQEEYDCTPTKYRETRFEDYII